MTRDEMLKINWKAYMEINYTHPRMKQPILCLLVEIDFDEESLTLQPIVNYEYKAKEFIANINHCSIPKKKIQAACIDGKKIKQSEEVQEYHGSTNRKNPLFSEQDDEDNDAS